MRWTETESKTRRLFGLVRHVRRFVVFPLKLSGEVRALEVATIKQRYGIAGWQDECFWDGPLLHRLWEPHADELTSQEKEWSQYILFSDEHNVAEPPDRKEILDQLARKYMR